MPPYFFNFIWGYYDDYGLFLQGADIVLGARLFVVYTNNIYAII